LVSAELALTGTGSSGGLGEDQLAEDIGERSVTDAPGFQFRMKVGIEETAVIACDTEGLILADVGAVDQVEQLQKLFIEPGECVVGLKRSVAKALGQASKREFVEVLAICAGSAGAHRE